MNQIEEYKPTQEWIEGREFALSDIRDRRRKQLIKWGVQSLDEGTYAKIMGEEFGEVCRCMLNLQFIDRIETPLIRVAHERELTDKLRDELVDLAAVAAAMIQQIDQGKA